MHLECQATPWSVAGPVSSACHSNYNDQHAFNCEIDEVLSDQASHHQSREHKYVHGDNYGQEQI